MTIQELFTQLIQLDVKLWLDGEYLCYNAPQGVMTPVLQAELAKYKTEIIFRLKNSTNLNNLNLAKMIPVARAAQIPLSFAQQRLWFLDQFEPNSASYNIPSAVRLRGELNEAALRRTLNEIVRRHESLRTSFAMQDGAPVQIIAEQLVLTLPVTDLTDLPTAERESRVMQLAQVKSQTPFDLSTGPLIRTGLIRLGTTEHILLFTMHHIVSDGWSMGVLVNEIVALYAAYVQNKPSPLAELTIQYADFAHWQRQWLSGDVLQQQLNYWTEQLSGSPTLLTLPTDFPRPAVQRYAGATHAFEISAQTTAGLYALNKQTQTTLFMTLLAAFNVLLARYSGQDDICIGTSIANRSRAEIEGLIGFFVNTLVLRTSVDSTASFERLLQQVRVSTLGAYAHQDVSFEQLVEVLKPERHTSHSPLFQVMLELQNTPMDNLELPGLTLQLLPTDTVTAKFDLTLNVTEADGQLVASFEYNTDLFSQVTIERMSGHFTRLLDKIVANPNVPIRDLHMLGADELHQLLVEWNATETAYPLDQCIHQLFEEQAQKTPDAIAAECEDQRLSYLELNQQANLLAFYLTKNAVAPEKLVAFYLERDLHFLIAMLAVFKAGAAYLPLDLHYPTDRLNKILKTSQANIILVNRQDYAHLSQHLSSLPEATRPQIMILEDILEKNEKHSNPNIYVESSYLAYVIYTSGSTGMPKGAMVEHRGMLNHLYATISEISLTSSDIVAQTASQHFDISVWQFLAALMVGGRTQIFKQEIVRDPDKLVHSMAAAAVTVWEAVPSFIKAVLDLQRESRNPMERPTLECLRWLIATGEDLPPALCQLWLTDYPDVPILNAYGPAECSDDVTFHRIAQLEAINRSHTPVGRPIANLQIYILDQWLQPVPVGVNGEIYIGGLGVGRGYIRDAKRTADVFLPDPFSIDPGTRMYKSGDLGCYLPTGEIEFLGRVDFQVKIRGLKLRAG